MKLHGWCERCKKVRRVNVSGAGLARLAGGSVAVGVCDECANPQPKERRRP